MHYHFIVNMTYECVSVCVYENSGIQSSMSSMDLNRFQGSEKDEAGDIMFISISDFFCFWLFLLLLLEIQNGYDCHFVC